MSETVWPGQEVQQQWPGQEVQTTGKGQGEHGYAPAPPEAPKQPEPDPSQQSVQPTYPAYATRPFSLPDVQQPAPGSQGAPTWSFERGASFGPEANVPVDAGPRNEAATKIADAVAEGWRAPQPILPPEMQERQYRLWGPIGGSIVNSLYDIAGAGLFRLPNALMYGGAETANQITGDPRAGRDARMLGETIMALSGAGPRVAMPVAERLPGPRPQYVSERMAPDVSQLDPRNAINALIRHDIAENPPRGPDFGTPNQSVVERPPGAKSQPSAATAAPRGTETPAVPEAPIMGPGAPSSPPSGGWRPVQPGEVFQPGQQFRMNQTTGVSEVYEPPSPQPGAAGADVTTQPIPPKTPAQALNDFKTSVTQTVRDRASPGQKEGTIEDHNVYVPGVTRLESARVFDPEIAANHDAMLDLDPAGYGTQAKAIEQRNHDILKEKYLEQAGNENTVAALREQRQAVSPEALGVFKDEKPVDAQAVVDKIDEILDSPAGKVDAVRNSLNRIRAGLYDRNGNLETLPSQLYGSRRNLTTIRDASALTKEGSDAASARREIGQVLPVLDQVIGNGSKGYSDVYLPQWADFSRRIDQQAYLQSKTIGAGKITGQDGNLTANGMQKLLEQIAVDKSKPGNSRAKTLTEDQLNNLVAIRNELAAMQFRDNLAKSQGSPTVKKAATAARLDNPVMTSARDAVVHGVLHATGVAPAANLGYQFVVKPWLDRRAAARAEARGQKVLDTTRNQLLNTTLPTDLQ